MTSQLISDLMGWSKDDPEAIAVASPSGSLTSGELMARTVDRSAALFSAGIRAGDVVAVSADGIDEVVAFLSVLSLGAIPVSTPSETEFLATRAARLVHSRRPWAPSDAVSLNDLPSNTGRRPEAVAVGDGSVGILTSGTTGDPKLLLLDDVVISARLDGYFDWWPTHSFVNLFRLSAVAGFFALAAALRVRETYNTVSVIDQAAVEFCSRGTIAHLAGSPHHIQAFISAVRTFGQPLSFESVTTAGAPQTPPFVAAVKTVCRGTIRSVYGSTEAGGVALASEPVEGEFRGVIGRGADFEAVDAEHNPLPVGSEGLLRYRTPGLATSYLAGDQRAPVSPDGWFYPGDIGQVNEDGTVVVRGREGDVVNVGGVKVNPLTYENLAGTIDGVKDAACASVTFPDGSLHLVLAVIVRDEKTYRDVVHVFENQPKSDRPSVIVSVPSIPRNRSGKLMRDELASKLTASIRVSPSTN